MSLVIIDTGSGWAINTGGGASGGGAALDLVTAQANAIDAFIIRSGTSYGLVSGGADNRAALNDLMTSVSAGAVVRLPAGTFWVEGGGSSGNYVTWKAGVRFIGHPLGTTFKFTSPTGSHSPFRLSSNLTLEDIVFEWNMSSHPAIGADCSLVFGNAVSNVTLRRCRFLGDADTGSVADGVQLYWLGKVTPLALWNVAGLTMEDCEVARSTGTNFGVHVIGGSDHLYDNCWAHHNAADGWKVMGNAGSGQPTRMHWNKCGSDYNGQLIIQGQTAFTTTYTGTQTITPVHGARYLVDFASNGSITLANTVTGEACIFAKKIGSAGTVDIKRADGVVIATLSDRLCPKFVMGATTFALDSSGSSVTNGEGWDVAGTNLSWTQCSALGNEGSGFQVKPSLVGSAGNNLSAGIVFDCCFALSSWGANGFGVVNNITSGEVSPQDVTMSSCVAAGNFSNGFILSSTTLPIFSTTMNHCVSRNNGRDGLSIQSTVRMFIATGCRFEGNGAIDVGWSVKLQSAKGVRFRDCYFSGVDPTSQLLLAESDVNDSVNARCYGVLIDKAYLGASMVDVVFDYCRWHNHKATNGASTDIRFYTNELNPALTDFDQTVSGSPARLALGNGSKGVLVINSQQTASLADSSVPAAYAGGTTYSLTDAAFGNKPSLVTQGANIFRYINASPGSGHATTDPAYWVQVGDDIVSFAA